MADYLEKRKVIVISLFIVALTGSILAATILAEKGSGAISDSFSALAQGLEPYATFFFPRYPSRIMYLAMEISQASGELVFLNQDLKTAMGKCDCQAVKSQCVSNFPATCNAGQVNVYGDPCPPREKIGERQGEVKEKAEQISFLRNLLLKEMETGLDREIMSLRTEEADELRAALKQILDESYNLSALASQNSALPSNCSTKNCGPTCQLGVAFSIRACVSFGEQKPLNFRFTAKIQLSDLNLGQIRINSVNLGLPDEIELARLGDLSLTIPSQEMMISFGQPYALSSPQLSLPRTPEMTVPCPNFSGSSYQCSPQQASATESYGALNNYSAEFARLSQECQDTQGPDPVCEEQLAKQLREQYDKMEAECKANDCADCDNCEGCCNVAQLLSVINAQRARLDAEVAAVCKNPECFDPKSSWFEGKLPQMPGPLNYTNPEEKCPSQTISDYPASRLSCSASLPTIPKIHLPSLVIPDIILGNFNLPPFLYIHLPSFVFEDLILPEIDLCNLDECKFQFPSLKFRLPSLNLPSIRVPAVSVPEGAEVSLEPIAMPPIPFSLPQLSELRLVSLMMPNIQAPEISLPRPRLTLSFEGMDIDIAWAIASFILNRFGMPDFSMCIEWGLDFAPIVISFPDYYFTWPALPQMPQILFCKDISRFCRSANTALKQVTDSIAEIEATVNSVFLNDIQKKLDAQASAINTALADQLQQYMKEVSQLIGAELVKSGGAPAYVRTPEKKITIRLADIIGLPLKVPIHWPEKLKRILLMNPLTYDLPTIPLSNLSYTEDLELQFPGFQKPQLSVRMQFGAGCVSQPAGGGSPCPTGQFQSNLDSIIGLDTQTKETTKKIINILE